MPAANGRPEPSEAKAPTFRLSDWRYRLLLIGCIALGEAVRKLPLSYSAEAGAAAIVIAAITVELILRRRQAPPAAETPPPVVLAPPFAGNWLAGNSPSRRVPSHGTHLFGQTWALDLVPDPDHSVANLKPRIATMPRPDSMAGFGQPVLAPASGTVVAVCDGKRDQRVYGVSWLGFLIFMIRAIFISVIGVRAVMGNHLVLRLDSGTFLTMAHLRRDSIRVTENQRVEVGEQVAECGNTGNTSLPHLHIQVNTTADPWNGYGVPLVFSRYERKAEQAWHRMEMTVPGPGQTDRTPWQQCRTLAREP